jgi:hypothetical protein
MTYNQLVTTLQSLLSSHAMIQTVKHTTPKEWLQRESQIVYPVATFSINNGSLNVGAQQVYTVQFFFLDKSGLEAEYETDVTSDQIQIASDIVNIMRIGSNDYFIDDNVTFNCISDKYEDYLAGVEFTINITTQSNFSACDAPII